MKNKVFCDNCKYKYFVPHINIYGEEYPTVGTFYCKKTLVREDDYLRPRFRQYLCKDINKNNDCKEYKPDFFTRVKSFFQRK